MKKPKRARPRPVEPVDPVEVKLDELVAYWPALLEAVERDSSGLGSDAGRRAADPHAAVVNTDVQDVIVAVQRGCARLAAEAAALLNLDRGHRSTEVVLGHLVDWRRQLGARPHGGPLAGAIASDAKSWHRQARAALRLRTAERTVPVLCPDHRGDAPARLVVEADEGTLHPAYIGGRTPGERSEKITWSRTDAVRCPHCGKRWEGGAQLSVLRARLRFEDQRATAAVDGDLVDEQAAAAARQLEQRELAAQLARRAARERDLARTYRARAERAETRVRSASTGHVYYPRRNLRRAASAAERRAAAIDAQLEELT